MAKTIKLLLIEDDQLDRMAFRRFVEKERLGYECDEAASVLQGLSLLKEKCFNFDVIISDYNLGDGTALDIISQSRNIPVILTAGAGDEETAVKAYKAGAYDYIIKDINRNYLKTLPVTVDNVVKRFRTESRLRLLSAAIMSADSSIHITDLAGNIIFVNEAFCKLYGYCEDEIIGTSGNFIYADHEPYAQENDHQDIVYHIRKDGVEFPVNTSWSLVKNTSGQEIALVHFARDILEHSFFEHRVQNLNLKISRGMRITT